MIKGFKSDRDKLMSISSISLKSVLYTICFWLFFITCIYVVPRYLSINLGEDSPWISYLYTTAMGGIVFCASIVWIFTRTKSPARKKEENFWLVVICGGLMLYLLLHGFWTLFAITYPIGF